MGREGHEFGTCFGGDYGASVEMHIRKVDLWERHSEEKCEPWVQRGNLQLLEGRNLRGQPGRLAKGPMQTLGTPALKRHGRSMKQAEEENTGIEY